MLAWKWVFGPEGNKWERGLESIETEVNTVKPLLSGPPIKWTHSINRTPSRGPEINAFYFLL